MSDPSDTAEAPTQPTQETTQAVGPARWLGSVLSAGFALAVVGLLAVTVAGRVDAAPPAWLAAVVTFLPYQYAVGLGMGFAVWTMVPDRRLPPVGLAVLLLTGAGLWGPAWRARGSAGEGDAVRVRVLSWNLRRMWGGPDDGGDAKRCVVDLVRTRRPEVLALMEVSRENTDWLARELDLSCVHHTYRDSSSPRHGGVATCTRGERWSLGKGAGQRFVDHEDWYFLQSEVRGPAVFNLLAVHLSPYDYAAKRLRSGVAELARGEAATLAKLGRSGREVFKGQSDQAAALLDRVERFRDPVVLAGDFNSTRDAALHVALRRRLVDTWEQGGMGFGGTIRFADWLPLRIDYIYATHDFGVRGAQVLPSGCSDHRPVLADLVLARSTLTPPPQEAR